MRENARKPRLAARKGTPDGERLAAAALAKIQGNLGACADLCEQLLNGFLEYRHADGRREWIMVTPEHRLSAAKEFMDRGGLPRKQATELTADAQPPVEIVFKFSGGRDG